MGQWISQLGLASHMPISRPHGAARHPGHGALVVQRCSWWRDGMLRPAGVQRNKAASPPSGWRSSSPRRPASLLSQSCQSCAPMCPPSCQRCTAGAYVRTALAWDSRPTLPWPRHIKSMCCRFSPPAFEPNPPFEPQTPTPRIWISTVFQRSSMPCGVALAEGVSSSNSSRSSSCDRDCGASSMWRVGMVMCGRL